MPETPAAPRSARWRRRPGELELSLRAGDRLGGHVVQGHVDGLGTVESVTEEGFARVVRIAAPGELLRYVVEKGSIAVDGVSLTVAEVDAEGFSVSLIPRRSSGPTSASPPRPLRQPRGRRAGQVRGEARVEDGAGVTHATFSTIEEALEDIRDGKMVVVCDAEDRENEGDLTLAAQFATPDAINFMAMHARGLICLALTGERCDELGLDLMAAKNESAFETAFTVSIEAREGVTTGSPPTTAPTRSRWRSTRARGRRTSSSRAISSRSRPSAAACSSGRPDRGGGGPGAAGGPQSGRSDLRDHERGRHDGPRAGPGAVLRAARPEDDHGGGPDRLPAPPRQAGGARRGRRPCPPSSATSAWSASARSWTRSTTWRWSRATSRSGTT